MLSRFFGNTTASSSSNMLENLESRQMMAVQPVPAGIIGLKIAKVSVSGVALDESRITIAFASNIRLKDATLFRNFGYANDLTTANGQRKVTVGLTVTAPVQPDGSTNVLQIITDRLVRKGSKFFIYSGAITTTKNAPLVYDGTTATNGITLANGQNKPRYTLSNRAWVPTDLSYVSSAVYTGAGAGTTASGTIATNTVTANLTAFLQKKVDAGTITAAQMTTALATYNSSATAGIIPDANLRAALVSLTGTVAEGAISTYLTKNNVTGKSWAIVTFDSSVSSTAPTAETKLNSNSRLQTILRPSLTGESFELLSAILAREAMHQQAVAINPSTGGLDDSLTAEVYDNDVAMTVYGQQLLTDPTPAGNGTFLSKYLNTQLVALLNSGQGASPYGGVLQAPLQTNNGNVFGTGAIADPGAFGNSTTVKSFDDFIRRDFTHRGLMSAGDSLVMSPYAKTVIANITGQKTTVFTTFSAKNEAFLDTSNVALVDLSQVKLAHDLKLNF